MDPSVRGALTVSDHLTPTCSDRGFTHLPEVTFESTGSVRVYESSSAECPRIWLSVTQPRPLASPASATAHLTLDEARMVAEQLLHLCDHHHLIRLEGRRS